MKAEVKRKNEVVMSVDANEGLEGEDEKRKKELRWR